MSRKKTTEEFIKEANLEERGIEMLDSYDGVHTKIKFKCLKDGWIWETTPSSVLHQNTGCPKCGGRCGNDIIKQDEIYLWIDISTKKFKDAIMKVDRYIWNLYLKLEGGRVYAVSMENNKYIYAGFHSKIKKKPCYFHHFILPVHEKLDTDHCNHGTMSFIDNTIENLEYQPHSKNMENQSLRKDNTTGITGVSYNKRDKVYETYIAYTDSNGVRHHKKLGYFKDIEDARKAREIAEKKYHSNSYSKNNP